MDKDRRYNIRKAREQEYTVSECSFDRETLEEFYDHYEHTIERVDGIQYPFSFFKALSEQLPESVRLYRAEVDGMVVGYHLYLFDELQSTIIHSFSGVKSTNFEYYPSELIHSYIISGEYNNYNTYDFGRTIADRGDGLFKYKREYGGDVLATPVWRRPFG
ncbi:MAG: GNAT family N-acetyltransferase, partial [Halobacteriaceae archaeon]